MSAFGLLRRVWHLMPPSIQSRGAQYNLGQVARSVLGETHNDIYDSEYYGMVDRTTSRSAAAMAQSLVRDLRPRTLLDVGCGTGAMLAVLRDWGVKGEGLEYSLAGLEYCERRNLDVRRFDLEARPLPLPAEKYDVVLSMEVAEHLPERIADAYVDGLVSQSDTVVFTAATPGQGGTDHVNEQPHSYWIDKFSQRGFCFDERLSIAWRREWELADVQSWYSRNLMIFRTQG